MDNIQQKFSKDAKFLYIFKNGPETFNGHTTQECLQDIMTNGIPNTSFVNTLHCGPNSSATSETSLALGAWIIQNGGRLENYITKNNQLESPKIFQLFEDEIFKHKAEKKGFSSYNYLREFYPTELRLWSRELRNFVYETFDELADGDICAMPCHSPTVETIFNCFSREPKEADMKPLEGFFLIYTKEGLIKTLF